MIFVRFTASAGSWNPLYANMPTFVILQASDITRTRNNTCASAVQQQKSCMGII